MGMFKRLDVAAILAAAAVAFAAPEAAAQALCETEDSDDFLNFSYDPVRPISLHNGRLSVLANDIIADDEHDRESATEQILTRMSDEALHASARVSIIDALADADTWLFGWAEAGLELNLEARNLTTGATCTDREELYIARWNEVGTPSGTRTLGCDLTRSAGSPDFIAITVEAHAWVTVGGAAGGHASMNVQIEEVSLEGCSGSCAGACGGASSGGCFCDASCSFFGDCCADFAPVCETNSCWEQCGGASPDFTCFCDDLCTGFGDCCSDFSDSCP